MNIGYIRVSTAEQNTERQREGIEIAKAKGVYKGKSEIVVDSRKFGTLYDKYLHREINKVEFAKQLGVSRPTLDKILKKRT